ncbi:MAG: GIY-YIG nuclease family protein [Bacteroidales bacterium]|nr:GIY-YIG nuclease family protein [Bacteroidales bacterium]
MSKTGFVYIMTNKNRSTLYVGVTNDLCRRIFEHKQHLIKNSFTDKYNLEYCIYYEEYPYFDLAIFREKELKKWSRKKKEQLIKEKNPQWNELVTEHGFVRDGSPSFTEASVNSGGDKEDGVPPFNQKGCACDSEIPPFGRNDGPLIMDGGGVESGGAAAFYSSTLFTSRHVIPNEAQRSEESACQKTNAFISKATQYNEEPASYSTNHNIGNREQRSEDSASQKTNTVISKATQYNEEPASHRAISKNHQTKKGGKK